MVVVVVGGFDGGVGRVIVFAFNNVITHCIDWMPRNETNVTLRYLDASS